MHARALPQPEPSPDGPLLRVVPAAPQRRHERRADIQGLRAIAVLLVVAFHAGLDVPGGFTGVDVFFVISGFVITGSLVNELETSGRISFAHFYARRVKRLLPALALMLVVVAAAGTLASPAAAQGTGALTGVFASLFAANIYLYTLGAGYFDVSTTLNPLLHTWTLAVEEQIYLVFPLLLVVGWRLRRLRSRRVLVAALVAIGSLVSFAYSQLLSSETIVEGIGSPVQLAFYSAPTRAWEFGAGAVLLLASPLVARVPAVAARVLGLIGLGLVAWAALLASPRTFDAADALVPVLGACALLAMGTATRGGTARLLATRPAVWIGDRSYGWYLWHWPLIVFAVALWPGSRLVAPLAALAALVPTALSYRYLENPVRRASRLRGRAVVVLALVCIAVPLAASLGALAVAHRVAVLPSMTSWGASRELHVDSVRGCDNSVPLGQRAGLDCTWHVPHPRGRIVLVGDSNAGHFSEPVVRAGTRAGFDVTVATFSSCAVVPLPATSALCRTFVRGTLAALVRRPPSLVILSSRTDDYVEHDGGHDGPTSSAAEARTKARLWRAGLTATLARLNAAGIPVVLVHPVPRLPAAPDSCATVRVLTGTCGGSVRRSVAEQALSRSVGAGRAAVAASADAWALTFDDELCSATRCSAARNGVTMYRDAEHLSILGALTLTPRFARAIAAHARPRPSVRAMSGHRPRAMSGV